MITTITQEGQTLVDVCVQLTGDTAQIVELNDQNPELKIGEVLPSGVEVKFITEIQPSNPAKVINQKKIQVVTGDVASIGIGPFSDSFNFEFKKL